jgi:hypothetical protein
MNVSFVDDRLDALNVVLGAFLVLVGLGTLAGMPWQYGGGALVMVGNVVGSLAAVGIGVGLAWLAYDSE